MSKREYDMCNADPASICTCRAMGDAWLRCERHDAKAYKDWEDDESSNTAVTQIPENSAKNTKTPPSADEGSQ